MSSPRPELRRSTRSLEAVVAAIALAAIAIRTDRYQAMTLSTVELQPGLRPMNNHLGPEDRIRFLDNSVAICETQPWRCRGNHATAEEGTVDQTAPSTNFGGRYANRSQVPGPKSGSLCRTLRCQNLAASRADRQLHADLGSCRHAFSRST